jgi:hypothetical protein
MRLRFVDVYRLYKQANMKKIFFNRLWVLCLQPEADYVWLVNIMLYSFMTQRVSWWTKMHAVGAFKHTPLQCSALFKIVSDKAKVFGGESNDDWYHFLENNSLFGYRNLPVSDFDPVAEAEKLATAGTDRAAMWLEIFDKEAHNVTSSLRLHEPPRQRSFLDFIAKADWGRSGSSSIGRVSIKLIGGKTKTIKARKNFVLDLLTPQQILTQIEQATEAVHTLVIKSELGKVRPAVASPLTYYLCESYVLSFIGDLYQRWEGIASLESLPVLFSRFSYRYAQIRQGYWYLPYDYSRFDHQPTLKEVNSMFSAIKELASQYISPSVLNDFEFASSKVFLFINNGFITYTHEQNIHKFKVTGGIMSGILFTSLFGNLWNLIVMRIASRTIGMTPPDVMVKGDDSELVSPTPKPLIRMALALNQLGIETKESSLAIHHSATEFLRVWTSLSGNHGYLARVLPSVVQQKPWNNLPWSPTSRLKAVFDNVSILQRRQADRNAISLFRTYVMSLFVKLTPWTEDTLALPVRYGGLSLKIWDGVRRVRTKTSNTSLAPMGVRVIPKTHRTQDYVYSLARKYQVSLSRKDVNQITQSLLVSKLTSTDVAAFDLPRPSVVVTPLARPEYVRHFFLVTPSFLAQLRGLQQPPPRTSKHLLLYGSYHFLKNPFQQLTLLRQRPMSWFKNYHPSFYLALTALERRGMRRSQALSILFGDLSMPPFLSIHPMLFELVEFYSMQYLDSYVRDPGYIRKAIDWEYMLHVTVATVAEALSFSPLSKLYFMW